LDLLEDFPSIIGEDARWAGPTDFQNLARVRHGVTMTRSALAAALICTVAPLTCASAAHAQPVGDAAAPMRAEVLVDMKELAAPIVDAGRIDGVLRVQVTLQAPDASSAARLAGKMAELRAAGLSTLIEFARLYASQFNPVDVKKLSAALIPAFSRVEPSIVNVFIVKVSARGA
jgi:flagellar basal body-associated protein FliL